MERIVQPADPEIGWSTTDDGWEPLPTGPSVSDLVMAFAWYGYSRLRLLILWVGLHRWRR